MKTRSFLLSTLAVFIFAGCSSEDAREGNIPGGELDGKAYLSLSLQSHTATSRAVNVEEKPGSSGESKAGAARVDITEEGVADSVGRFAASEPYIQNSGHVFLFPV